MKGLIIKDIFLLKEMKKTVLLFAVISIVLLIGGGQETFVMGYFNIMAISVAISSMAYDDYNKGYSFLMTLPITRKQYVIEKYLFSMMICFGVWLASVIMTGISVSAKGGFSSEWVSIWLVFIGIAAFVIAMTLPFALKYGSDKGRTTMLVLVAGLFVVIFFGGKLLEKMGISLDDIVAKLTVADKFTPVIFFVVVIAALCVSMKISIGIMERKEF